MSPSGFKRASHEKRHLLLEVQDSQIAAQRLYWLFRPKVSVPVLYGEPTVGSSG